MSLKQEDMVPQFCDDDPINYYDLIIDVNSFRHLQKSDELTDWGWNVFTNKTFNYKEATEKYYVSMGVVGNGNRGKSFLLSKISGFDFPTGYSVKTKGISIKYPNKDEKDSKNIVVFDTAGFETPLVETTDFQLGKITNSTKAEQIINEIARDRTIVEYFTQKFILTYSNVIIAVVGQLTFSEQQLLIKIKNENKNKKIFVVHNLYNFETVNQVKDYIENTLLKSLTFKITLNKYVNCPSGQEEAKNQNDYYYHEELGKQSIEHLILGKEGSESGDYYNTTTLYFLRTNVTAETKVKKVPVIENVKKHLYSTSNFIFEHPIPKDKIQYQEGDSNSDGKIAGKIFVDSFDKPIILKKIATDSLGASSFYGQAFLPNYSFFVVNSYKDLPELAKLKLDTTEIKDLSELENKPIYILQVELPGECKFNNDPIIDLSSEGKIFIHFKGKRNLKEEEIKDESRKDDSYRNEIKQGKFSLFFEISNEIISIERTLLGKIYEDGIYSFYYRGEVSNEKIEEITF